MCFQLFQDYYTLKKLELQEQSEKTPLSSEIDRMLELEPKVRTVLF